MSNPFRQAQPALASPRRRADAAGSRQGAVIYGSTLGSHGHGSARASVRDLEQSGGGSTRGRQTGARRSGARAACATRRAPPGNQKMRTREASSCSSSNPRPECRALRATRRGPPDKAKIRTRAAIEGCAVRRVLSAKRRAPLLRQGTPGGRGASARRLPASTGDSDEPAPGPSRTRWPGTAPAAGSPRPAATQRLGRQAALFAAPPPPPPLFGQ